MSNYDGHCWLSPWLDGGRVRRLTMYTSRWASGAISTDNWHGEQQLRGEWTILDVAAGSSEGMKRERAAQAVRASFILPEGVSPLTLPSLALQSSTNSAAASEPLALGWTCIIGQSHMGASRTLHWESCRACWLALSRCPVLDYPASKCVISQSNKAPHCNSPCTKYKHIFYCSCSSGSPD